MPEHRPASDPDDFLQGGGETGALIRAYDWSATSLGAIGSWPQSLKTAVSMIVHSPVPIVMLWGEDGYMIYNDAYSVFAGGRHPKLLGSKVREGWPEVADFNDNVMKVGLAGGTLAYRDQELTLYRHGRPEQVWMNLDYSPVYDESGKPAGVVAIVVETTGQVLAQRRQRAEHDRLMQMFRQAPGFMAMLQGPDHIIEFANPAYLRLVGWRDVIGKPVAEALPELAEQGFLSVLDDVYRSGKAFVGSSQSVLLQFAPGGPLEERFVDFVYQPITDATGDVTGIFVEGVDATDRVKAQARVSESEARYRQIVEGAEDFAIITVDDAGIIQAWSSGAERILGYSEEEAVGQPGAIIFTPEERAAGAPEHEVNRAEASGRALNERWHVRKDGSRFWGSGLTMRLAGGGGYLKIFRDRTAEHEAEAAAEESRRELQRLADTLPALVSYIDAKEHYLFCNKAYESWFADRDEPVTGHTVREVIGERAYAGIKPWIDRALAGERVGFDQHMPYSETHIRDVHVDFVPREGADGGIEGFYALVQDVSERRRIERAIRRQAEEFQTLTDNMPALCWMAEPDGHIFWYNRRWYDYTGTTPESQEGWGWESVHDPEMLPRVIERWRHSIATGEPFEMTFPLRGADGIFRPFLTRIVPIRDEGGAIVRWFGTNVDVTEQVEAEALLERRVAERTAELLKAEEALRQAQKMEAMGQLTGGVAHDFNNLLTPIVGSLDLLSRRGVGGEREQRLIEGALQSAERAATLVQRLLAFARRQPLQPAAVDLTQLVRGMAELVASTTGPQIKVVVDVPADLPPALADANQLEMAILNLSVNARDAMPDGGTLRISAVAETTEKDEAGLGAGSYVRLSVADTGQGMDAETLARAVEPFFSTKGIGKGTGLGLSMVHGLALQLGGALRLSSRPGLGTNVELWLPIADRPAKAMVAPEVAAPAPVGAGTALLVDDEELVRASTADMLIELGYEVVEAGSAEEALRHLEQGLAPSLLVTDHLMPGMSGTDLARHVRSRTPSARVLIVSGYAEVEDIARDLPRLTKPFRRTDLADAIAEIGTVSPGDSASASAIPAGHPARPS